MRKFNLLLAIIVSIFLLSFYGHEQTANGTAETMYWGTRPITTLKKGNLYYLEDRIRGIYTRYTPTYAKETHTEPPYYDNYTDSDNLWQADSPDNYSVKTRLALESHFAAQMTYDYFVDPPFSSNGFDDNGSDIHINMHTLDDQATWRDDQGKNEVNLGSKSYPGFIDYLARFDVVAHEIGHGITRNLNSNVGNDAISEGFSDIWSACVSNYTNNLYGTDKNIWLYGEDYIQNNKRSMSNPKSTGNANTYEGEYFQGDKYLESTVLSHWFYLLSEGSGEGEESINDCGYEHNVVGIGIDKAAEIAWETAKILTASTFGTVYTKSIAWTVGKYGSQSPETESVKEAWKAVGLGLTNCCQVSGLAAPPNYLSHNQFKLEWNNPFQATSSKVYVNNVLNQTTTDEEIFISALEENGCYLVEVVPICNGVDGTGQILEVTTPNYTFTDDESFEDGFEDWNNTTGDNFDWSISNDGTTPSSSTGPTSAFHCEKIVYIETSIGSFNNNAFLLNSNVDLRFREGAGIKFYYHMYGNDINKLELQVKLPFPFNSPWQTLWTKYGDQGNSWKSALVDLTPYLNRIVALRFVAYRGNGYRGDIALDQIKLLYSDDFIPYSRVDDASELTKTTEFLKIYPNPSNGFVKISGSSVENLPFAIYNTAGRLVKSGEISNDQEIIVNNLISGIYLIRFNGGETQTVKTLTIK